MAGGKSSGQKKVGVYFLHNPSTDETYVGSGDLSARKSRHFTDLRGERHVNSKLQEAFNRNPNFEFKPVPTESLEEARELEQGLIRSMFAKPGFLNIAKDVVCPFLGRTHTEDTRKKMSEAQKGHPNYPRTPEGQARVTAVHRGQKYNLGRVQTLEEKQRRGEAMSEFLKDPSSREQRRRESLARSQTEEGRTVLLKAAAVSSESRRREVSISGVVYSGPQDAAHALGLDRGTVHWRINSSSGQYSDWYYVDKEK